jgi:hypothetical protein
MSIFFTALLIFVAIYSLLSLIPTLATYGKPLKDEQVLAYVERNKFRLNPYDYGIVMNDAIYEPSFNKFDGGAFYVINFTVFFKYQIDGMGTVWRWSKGAKALDKVRENLVYEG